MNSKIFVARLERVSSARKRVAIGARRSRISVTG
jgi:hypothetical protein